MSVPKFDVIGKPLKKHKVKKKERMEDIAKAYRIKSWKKIWEFPANKAVRSKRKDPKTIRAGDEFMIPLSDADEKKLAREKKLLAENITKTRDQRDANADTLKATNDSIDGITKGLPEVAKMLKDAEESVGMAKRTAATSSKGWDAIIKKHDDSYRGIEKLSKGIDAAGTVCTTVASLGLMTHAAAKATKLAGQQLDNVNKELMKDAMSGPVVRVTMESKRLGVYEKKQKDSMPTAVVKTALDSFVDINTPSFWAGSVAQLIDGKGWSEAVTYDYAKEHKSRIAQLESSRAKTDQMYSDLLDYWTTKAKVLGDFKKDCEAEKQRLEGEVAPLEKQIATQTRELTALEALRAR